MKTIEIVNLYLNGLNSGKIKPRAVVVYHSDDHQTMKNIDGFREFYQKHKNNENIQKEKRV